MYVLTILSFSVYNCPEELMIRQCLNMKGNITVRCQQCLNRDLQPEVLLQNLFCPTYAFSAHNSHSVLNNTRHADTPPTIPIGTELLLFLLPDPPQTPTN